MLTDCQCEEVPQERAYNLGHRVLCAECGLEEAVQVLQGSNVDDREWSDALYILREVPALLDGERKERKARAEASRKRILASYEVRARELSATIRDIAGLPRVGETVEAHP